MAPASPQTSTSLEGQEIAVCRWGSPAFKCAVAETQGQRESHEDAHSVLCTSKTGAFWVLDGHRGDAAARYGAKHLPLEVRRQDIGGQFITQGLPADESIEQGFEHIDCQLRTFLNRDRNTHGHPGSTVVGAMVARQIDGTYSAKLANCGDSRGVLMRGPTEGRGTAPPAKIRLPQSLESARKSLSKKEGWDAQASWLPTWPAIVETIDHKPNSFSERSRIEAAGGHISGGRVARLDGHLAVSRGLGDFDFKGDRKLFPADQKVSCMPDIYEVTNIQPGSLLLLACDGLWDVMSTQDAVHFVRSRLKRDPFIDIGDIAASLIRNVLKLDSGDNVTVLLAHFTDGDCWPAEQ